VGGKGSGGKNRKPTALKKLQGNAGKRKLNAREPKPKLGVPEMPMHLSKLAKVAWRRLIPILSAMKVLTVADGDALGGYCSAITQWILSDAAIAKYGILTAELDESTGTSILRTNPAVRVRSDALRHMRSFESEFGLTPASRSKLSIHVNDDDDTPDALDELFDGPAQPNRKPN
jgi:P27 family predicted phage terminase small subunit